MFLFKNIGNFFYKKRKTKTDLQDHNIKKPVDSFLDATKTSRGIQIKRMSFISDVLIFATIFFLCTIYVPYLFVCGQFYDFFIYQQTKNFLHVFQIIFHISIELSECCYSVSSYAGFHLSQNEWNLLTLELYFLCVTICNTIMP